MLANFSAWHLRSDSSSLASDGCCVYIVGCLAAHLASTHWVPATLPSSPTVGMTKNVSRHWQMSLGSRMIRTTPQAENHWHTGVYVFSRSVLSNYLWPHGPPGSSVHGDSPGKSTEVGCCALPQRIFPTRGSNPGLPHCRQIFYHLSRQRILVGKKISKEDFFFPLSFRHQFP